MIKQAADGTTVIVCSRPKRCSYCDAPHTKLCDGEKGAGKTCDVPLCDKHTWHPDFGKDYCRMCRRKIEGPSREEQRQLEMASRKRDTLIFFAQSKYDGWCREKDCGAKWKQGDPMYWDSKTREVFCAECGELLQN